MSLLPLKHFTNSSSYSGQCPSSLAQQTKPTSPAGTGPGLLWASWYIWRPLWLLWPDCSLRSHCLSFPHTVHSEWHVWPRSKPISSSPQSHCHDEWFKNEHTTSHDLVRLLQGLTGKRFLLFSHWLGVKLIIFRTATVDFCHEKKANLRMCPRWPEQADLMRAPDQLVPEARPL